MPKLTFFIEFGIVLLVANSRGGCGQRTGPDGTCDPSSRSAVCRAATGGAREQPDITDGISALQKGVGVRGHNPDLAQVEKHTEDDDKVTTSTAWTVVLKWETKPEDLDAVTQTLKGATAVWQDGSAASSCDVDYIDAGRGYKKCSNGMAVRLSLDNMNITASNKRETTEIELKDLDPEKCQDNCKLIFSVQDFSWKVGKSDQKTFLESKARVELSNGEASQTFLLGKDGKVENHDWYVFGLDLQTAKTSAPFRNKISLCSTKDCNTPSPIDCTMNDWKAWGACSATCGSGTRSRSRTVEIPAQHGGKACPNTEDQGVCNKVCPAFKTCGKVMEMGTDPASPVAGVKVQIVEKKLEVVTDSSGEFCFNSKEPGEVTLRATKQNWVEETWALTITRDTTSLDDLLMSKVLMDTEWRIVLTWTAGPKDLDAQTEYCPTSGKLHYQHAVGEYWYNQENLKDNDGYRKCLDNKIVVNPFEAKLEKDTKGVKATKQGEETTRLRNVDPKKCGNNCKIYFAVHHWRNNTKISRSNAMVEVINGDQSVKKFHILKDGKVKDNYWYVFAIDVKKDGGSKDKVIACTDAKRECA